MTLQWAIATAAELLEDADVPFAVREVAFGQDFDDEIIEARRWANRGQWELREGRLTGVAVSCRKCWRPMLPSPMFEADAPHPLTGLSGCRCAAGDRALGIETLIAHGLISQLLDFTDGPAAPAVRAD